MKDEEERRRTKKPEGRKTKEGRKKKGKGLVSNVALPCHICISEFTNSLIELLVCKVMSHVSRNCFTRYQAMGLFRMKLPLSNIFEILMFPNNPTDQSTVVCDGKLLEGVCRRVHVLRWARIDRRARSHLPIDGIQCLP